LIEQTKEAVREGGDNLDLSRLLSRHNAAQTGEDKDNVIGLLRLARDQLGIEVDYTEDTDQFFWNVAVKLLQADGNLDILGDIDHGGMAAPYSTLPSWAPRWQTSRALITKASSTTRLADYGNFCASGDASRSCPLDLRAGGKLLHVSGHMPHTISKRGKFSAGFTSAGDDNAVYEDWECVIDARTHRRPRSPGRRKTRCARGTAPPRTARDG
jgi:hypothetical protein